MSRRRQCLCFGVYLILTLTKPASPLFGEQGKPISGGPQRTDHYGDRLPLRATARLGTRRFRHGGEIACVAISPDGKIVASGGRFSEKIPTGVRAWGFVADRKICLWDTATGREIRQLRAPQWQVHCLTFSPDGRTLAAGCGNIVGLWDVATGKEILQFKRQGESASSVMFCTGGKRLASGGDSHLYLWEVNTGNLLKRWSPWKGKPPLLENGMQAENYQASALSPDGKYLAWGICKFEAVKGKPMASSRAGDVLRIQDAATSRQLYQIEVPAGDTRNITFSPDGRLLALGSNWIQLWDLSNGKRLRELKGFNASATALLFSPDRNTLASGHCDGRVLLWSTKSGKILRRFSHAWNQPFLLHRFPLAFSPDGKRLSIGTMATVRLWDVATGKELSSLQGHRNPVRHLHFSANGRTLTSSCGARFCQWRTTTWQAAGRFDWFESQPSAEEDPPDISCDGKYYHTRAPNGSCLLHDTATGKVLRTFPKRKPGIAGWTFSPDGKTLFRVSGGEENLGLTGFQVSDGKPISRMELTNVQDFPVFSPNNKFLAWQGEGATVYLGNGNTGKVIRQLGKEPGNKEHQLGTNALIVFSPDARLLATVLGEEGAIFSPPKNILIIHLWRTGDGRELRRFIIPGDDNHPLRFAALAISPDGRFLASGQHGESAVRVWEVASGRERGQFHGHRAPVVSLVFSPDGRFLASGSEDNTVLIWDLKGPIQTGRPSKANPTSKALMAFWTDLAGTDGPRADDAIWALIGAPGQSVPFLKERLRPVRGVKPERLARLIANLESERYAVRNKATRELESFQELAAPALRRALQGRPSVEVYRRIEQVIKKLDGLLPSPDRLREARALEALERMGTPEARRLLEALAEGEPRAQLTKGAKAALGGLAGRRAEKP